MANPEVIPVPGKFEDDLRNDQIERVIFIERVEEQGYQYESLEGLKCPVCPEGEYHFGEGRREIFDGLGTLILVGSIYAYRCSTPDCGVSDAISAPVRAELRKRIKSTPALPICDALQERILP